MSPVSDKPAAAFTPGPWEVSILTPVLVVKPLGGEMVRNLAHVPIPGNEPLKSPAGTKAIADARLIAASPNLFDGCNALLGLCQLLLTRDDLPPAVREALANSHRVEEARAAIAKALGTSEAQS